MSVRDRNMEKLLDIVNTCWFISIGHLSKKSQLEIGIRDKMFNEYLELLRYNGRVLVENGWVVSKYWEGPMPWTDNGARYRNAVSRNDRILAKKILEDFKSGKKEIPKEEMDEVDGILGA